MPLKVLAIFIHSDGRELSNIQNLLINIRYASRKSWDGQIKKWRRQLHVFDPPSPNGDMSTVDDVNTAPV